MDTNSINIKDILKNLGAVQNGDYFILYCPYCGKREAYCYIDDINKWNLNHSHKIPIRCNRLNKCGKVSYLNDYVSNNVSLKNIEIKSKSPIQMSYEGVNLLQTYCKYIVDAVHCNTEGFDFSLRGISNQTLKANGIIYNKKSFQSLINQDTTKKYFGKKYRSKNYLDRNIIIPIFNKERLPERLLLRSTNHHDINYKKEIQVMLVKKGLEIWNIQDLLDISQKVIFVTEGVYDALSIKEVCPEVGTVALPGVKKYKQLLQFMNKENILNKHIVFCFDNDDAGKEIIEKATKDFQKKGVLTINMNLGIYKDCNEYLCENREEFERNVKVLYFKSLRNLRYCHKQQNYNIKDI